MYNNRYIGNYIKDDNFKKYNKEILVDNKDINISNSIEEEEKNKNNSISKDDKNNKNKKNYNNKILI